METTEQKLYKQEKSDKRAKKYKIHNNTNNKLPLLRILDCAKFHTSSLSTPKQRHLNNFLPNLVKPENLYETKVHLKIRMASKSY